MTGSILYAMQCVADPYPSLPYLPLQDQAALRKEFDQLLNTISKPPAELDLGMTKDEIKKLKDAAFGPLTFWVTETRPIQVREAQIAAGASSFLGCGGFSGLL